MKAPVAASKTQALLLPPLNAKTRFVAG